MSTFRYNESLISLKWIERNEKSNQKNIYSHKNLQFKFEKFLTYISLTFSLHIHRKCTRTIYNFFLLKASIKFLTIRANIHTKLIKTTLQQICTRYYYTRDQIPLPSWLKYFLTMGGPIISKSLIRIPLYIYIHIYHVLPILFNAVFNHAAIPRGNSHFVQQLIQFFRLAGPIAEPREIPPICPPWIIECHRKQTRFQLRAACACKPAFHKSPAWNDIITFPSHEPTTNLFFPGILRIFGLSVDQWSSFLKTWRDDRWSMREDLRKISFVKGEKSWEKVMGGIWKLDESLKIDVMLFELDRDFRISFFQIQFVLDPFEINLFKELICNYDTDILLFFLW